MGSSWLLGMCTLNVSSIGEGLEYRPFHDLRSPPKAGRACAQVLFLGKGKLGFFHFLEIVTGWLVPSTTEDPPS